MFYFYNFIFAIGTILSPLPPSLFHDYTVHQNYEGLGKYGISASAMTIFFFCNYVNGIKYIYIYIIY